MKYRSDFVTNSSSSSFIGAFAKITNDKAEDIVKKNNLVNYVKTGKEILEEMSHRYFYGYGADWAGVDITPRRESIDTREKYLVWEDYGSVDEDKLIITDDNDEFVDYDYDVCLEDFGDYAAGIFELISEENGFADVEKGYGAGYNG